MIILASKSPRRREILELMGIEFTVLPSDIEEEGVTAPSPEKLALKLATLKGLDVSKRGSGPVLSADTIVVVHGKILGKPKDEGEAKEMLKLLSGRGHEVITGVSISKDGNILGSFIDTTKVFFKELSEEEINWYVSTTDPYDKAGGYGVQSKGGIFVQKIEGCFFNVVGLPLARTANLLRQLGLFKLGG